MQSVLLFILDHAVRFFYKKIEVRGAVAPGPVIVYSNHSQGFMDGVVPLVASRRSLCLLAADVVSSMQSTRNTLTTRLIMKIYRYIPIRRQIDYAVAGTGLISIDGLHIIGIGTHFLTSLQPKDSLLTDAGHEVRIKAILSDSEAEAYEPSSTFSEQPYRILIKYNQRKAFESTSEALQKNDQLFMCPEGKSHENNWLLPFKPGLALMYLEARRKGIPCKLQPVGLIYTKQDNVRSKVLASFAAPLEFDDSVLQMKKNEAIKLINERLVQELEKEIVLAGTFSELYCLFLAERLLRQGRVTPDTKFARWKELQSCFKQMKTEEPAEYWSLVDDLKAYRLATKEADVNRYMDPSSFSLATVVLVVIKLVLTFFGVRFT